MDNPSQKLKLDAARIMRKNTIQKTTRKDPIIPLWQSNYKTNFEEGLLSNEKTRPLSFLEKKTEYRNIPVVLIAAGPSVDKNINDLKGHEDKCIIVCADVVLFKLIEHNIKPDFVVNVDPHESITRFWGILDTSDITLVCPTTTNPKSLHAWQGSYFFYNQVDDPRSTKGIALKKLVKPTQGWGGIFNRFFVGATMTEFASMFRPAPLILVGYDFAYTDGKAYCDGFLDIKIYHNENPEGTEEHKKRLADAIKKMKTDEVKKEMKVNISRGQTPIWTSRVLNMYKISYVQYSKQLTFPIINCTEGGILLDYPQKSLKDTLEKHCQNTIGNKDFFSLPKRKRKRKR